MHNSRAVFGFPKFQILFAERFGPVLPAIKRVEAALNGLVDRAYDSLGGWQHIILNLGRLSGVEMTELLILAANGCGHGAMKIGRSILETTIDAEYLRRHPERFQE
ncbi:MAG: hypothetical protein ACRD1Y_02625 [Terriglobales bacterium]